MYKILVCDPLSQTAIRILEDAPDVEFTQIPALPEAELAEKISAYNAIIVRSATKITEKIINKAENLKVIGRAGSGLDNIDQESAVKKGIKVLNTPGTNAPAVAELTIGLMFSLARQIPFAHKSMIEGKWAKQEFMGIEIAGKKLGIVGCGKIGKHVARMAAALGMEIVVYNQSPVEIDDVKFDQVSLDKLLQISDFITFHIPKTETTTGLITKKEFKKMKAGVYIVNTARAGIVIEKDLIDALNNGIVAGAALDVFENEPDFDRNLVQNPKVIATPHIGAASMQSQERVGVIIVDQILEYLRSKYIFL